MAGFENPVADTVVNGASECFLEVYPVMASDVSDSGHRPSYRVRVIQTEVPLKSLGRVKIGNWSTFLAAKGNLFPGIRVAVGLSTQLTV